MIETVNLVEIKQKLIEKLTPSGWAHKLKAFVNSSDMDTILEQLYILRESGRRFTPPLKHVFRAFEECPVDKLKVILIGQDPYPQLGVADGLAFSCSLTDKVQPSLKNIFEAVEATVYDGLQLDQDPDLTRWAHQGVLLLNKGLTTQVDKPGTHYDIWNDFLMYTLDMISLTNSGLIFILLGKEAHDLESVIGPAHHVLKASHPASAAYTKTTWDCKDVFNEANRLLESMNGPDYRINW